LLILIDAIAIIITSIPQFLIGMFGRTTAIGLSLEQYAHMQIYIVFLHFIMRVLFLIAIIGMSLRIKKVQNQGIDPTLTDAF
jgi:hypothetical protein